MQKVTKNTLLRQKNEKKIKKAQNRPEKKPDHERRV